MKLWNSIKAQSSMIKSYIIGFIGVIVLILVAKELIPQGTAAGNALNASTSTGGVTGISMVGLLTSSGVLWTLAVLGIFLIALAFFLGKGNR